MAFRRRRHHGGRFPTCLTSRYRASNPQRCGVPAGRAGRPAGRSTTVAHKDGKNGRPAEPDAADKVARMPRKIYEKELFRLQAELVKLQEWVRTEGARL